jgi:Phosphotransferase system, mannose/fructose/N-acetylgalactosamine-specific component IID
MDKEIVTNQPTHMAPPEEITTKDLAKSWFRWWYANEIPHSFDRMIAPSLLWALMPILRKLYKGEQYLKEAYERHTQFFNTQAIWGGGTILGITISLEEARAKELADGTADSDSEESGMINATKVGLMGPLAGIGDAIDSGTVQYILLAIFLPWAQAGSALGALIPWIAFVALTYAYGFYFVKLGHRLGRAAVGEIVGGKNIKRIINGLSVLGIFMMGILAASYVKVESSMKWSISGKEFALQKILDQVLPGLLPLITVMAIYWYFSKKGLKITQALLLTSVILGVLAAFGIL